MKQAQACILMQIPLLFDSPNSVPTVGVLADDGKHALSVIGVGQRLLEPKWEGVQGEGGALSVWEPADL